MAHSSASSGLSGDFFIYSTLEKESEAMNYTARRTATFIWRLGIATGNNLLVTILDFILPSVIVNKATAPFPFLWTELRKVLASQNIVLKRSSAAPYNFYRRRRQLYRSRREKNCSWTLPSDPFWDDLSKQFWQRSYIWWWWRTRMIARL